ncbi:hypothetical protein J4Q44_G00237930 [Coregonus suidteri]|uniref:Uncharacterized protein n=1 Tax=Coregonus suidteri TaxID=861788 RepID=A0AAN8QP17_9TELE
MVQELEVQATWSSRWSPGESGQSLLPRERVLPRVLESPAQPLENSLWNLEPGHCVVLSLIKSGEVWWSAVLKGEKEIDVNQINRERSMATVDEEEHAVLDRLTFDYHQKLQGKPQSHKMKVHDMLKKGWDAEGSPFKGQQFDPSLFDIPPAPFDIPPAPFDIPPAPFDIPPSAVQM